MTTDLITLPQIQEHLGLKIPGKFITDTLGIAPHSMEKRAVFFTKAQVPLICDKFARYVDARKNQPIKAITSAAVTKRPPSTPVDDDDDL